MGCFARRSTIVLQLQESSATLYATAESSSMTPKSCSKQETNVQALRARAPFLSGRSTSGATAKLGRVILPLNVAKQRPVAEEQTVR